MEPNCVPSNLTRNRAELARRVNLAFDAACRILLDSRQEIPGECVGGIVNGRRRDFHFVAFVLRLRRAKLQANAAPNAPAAAIERAIRPCLIVIIMSSWSATLAPRQTRRRASPCRCGQGYNNSARTARRILLCDGLPRVALECFDLLISNRLRSVGKIPAPPREARRRLPCVRRPKSRCSLVIQPLHGRDRGTDWLRPQPPLYADIGTPLFSGEQDFISRSPGRMPVKYDVHIASRFEPRSSGSCVRRDRRS